MNRPFRGREITEVERGGADAILVGVGWDRDETWARGGACTFQLHPAALVAPLPIWVGCGLGAQTGKQHLGGDWAIFLGPNPPSGDVEGLLSQ
jgi:hypothetical protein